MEGINKNKEQKDDALTAAYMLGRYDGQKEVYAQRGKHSITITVQSDEEASK